MDGGALFRRFLLLLMSGVALAGSVALHAQDTLSNASETAVAHRPGSGVAVPPRAQAARDEGHDGSGYFDRGFRRIIAGRGNDGHDGSGRFDHPAQPGGRVEEGSTAHIAVR